MITAVAVLRESSRRFPRVRPTQPVPIGIRTSAPGEQADADVRQVTPPAVPALAFTRDARTRPLTFIAPATEGTASDTWTNDGTPRWQPSTGRPSLPASTPHIKRFLAINPETRRLAGNTR
jgi:hypothetical protein